MFLIVDFGSYFVGGKVLWWVLEVLVTVVIHVWMSKRRERAPTRDSLVLRVISVDLATSDAI